MDKPRFLDLHCDTITRGKGLRGNGCQVDLLRVPEGWQWCQAFAVWVPDEYRGRAALDYFRRFAGEFHGEMARHRDRIRQVRSAREVEEALEAGLHAAFLTVEGGAALMGEMGSLDLLWEEGVRMLTLTWNGPNELGNGCAAQGGLTPFGKAALARMEELGMAADVSHLNDEGFADVVRLARRPFAASHSDSRAVRGHRRNLTDQQFMAIRDAGGIVGINFYVDFLDGLGPGRTDLPPESLVRHIFHFLELGGEDCIALGSDFDGAQVPDFIGDISGVATLREIMLQSGLGPVLADKILFRNGLDFWKRYEKS